ncbi:Na+-transporting malonate decarboxylase, carboxybiotin decarboxylase subunit [Chania multitudinisentens]|nr:Na+-transporting malonate decarboxylase, carboxybiotin decarboxylase subunit [Chania multitudinisentens]
MDILLRLFSGIGTFFTEDPIIAFTRFVLIVIGFALAYLGFRRKLDPLIMVPMGLGMIAINSGVLFLNSGSVGTIMLDPMVSEPSALMTLMQVNFLQPIYALTFSNGLVGCLIYLGIGTMSDVSFLLARPWASIIVALFAELGTFVMLVVGYQFFGLPLNEAAAIATIGGADGPLVMFSALIMSPNLFVPIAIIAYLYLTLAYAGFPYLVRLMVPKRFRGVETEMEYPQVSKKAKFIFIISMCTLLCLLLPAAAPLLLSFFVGMAIKEAEILPYHKLLESTITYSATLFLSLLLGTLCSAQTLLDPKVAIILILGVGALTVSGIGALAGGWFIYFLSRRNNYGYNPVVGISGVSCMPTCAKIAQTEVSEENPYSIILPVAIGTTISGIIVSAVAAGIFMATFSVVDILP